MWGGLIEYIIGFNPNNHNQQFVALLHCRQQIHVDRKSITSAQANWLIPVFNLCIHEYINMYICLFN